MSGLAIKLGVLAVLLGTIGGLKYRLDEAEVELAKAKLNVYMLKSTVQNCGFEQKQQYIKQRILDGTNRSVTPVDVSNTIGAHTIKL